MPSFYPGASTIVLTILITMVRILMVIVITVMVTIYSITGINHELNYHWFHPIYNYRQDCLMSQTVL